MYAVPLPVQRERQGQHQVWLRPSEERFAKPHLVVPVSGVLRVLVLAPFAVGGRAGRAGTAQSMHSSHRFCCVDGLGACCYVAGNRLPPPPDSRTSPRPDTAESPGSSASPSIGSQSAEPCLVAHFVGLDSDHSNYHWFPTYECASSVRLRAPAPSLPRPPTSRHRAHQSSVALARDTQIREEISTLVTR